MRFTNLGTPKSLQEAIENAMCLVVPAGQFPQHCREQVRDFLSQRFSVAQMRMGQWRDGTSTRYSPEEILAELWKQITLEDK